MNKIKKKLKANNELIPIYIVMLIMIAINIWKQPTFFKPATFARICNQLAPYIFMGMAQMCIMVLGGMDFGLGALVSLSTCIFATLMVENNTTNVFVIIGIILMIGCIDACVGYIVGRFNLPTIVVTLATSFVFEGLSLLILPTPGGFINSAASKLFIGKLGIFPASLIWCAVFAALWVIMRKSSAGLLIYATGNNKKSAFTSGLNVKKGCVLAFFMSGILAAMAGLMLCSRTMSGDPTIANDLTINAVTAAVLGGVTFSGGEGKLAGVIAGSIVVGILVNVLFFLNITGFYTYFVQGIILILSVVVNNLRKRGK